MALLAIIAVPLLCAVLLSALRLSSIIDEHERIHHEAENEKY